MIIPVYREISLLLGCPSVVPCLQGLPIRARAWAEGHLGLTVQAPVTTPSFCLSMHIAEVLLKHSALCRVC